MVRVLQYVWIVIQAMLLVVASFAISVCVIVFGIPGLVAPLMEVVDARNALSQQVANARAENSFLEAF